MIQIRVERYAFLATYTIGRMLINGSYYCDTLEDQVRDLSKEQKIYAATAIPAGKYEVRVTWSPKFKRNLPLLLGVPYFTGIRIHRGNRAADTSGCILVGENKIKGMVIKSTRYELDLTKLLSGEAANIEIVNLK